MITIYGIKSCDTVQKSIKWLKSKNIPFEFHDYKTMGISEEKLKSWTNKAGWETLVNRKGTTWKKLDEAVKESTTNEIQAIALMKEQTSVIKRPVIEENGILKVVGFDEGKYNGLFSM
jgi:arsenate reductase (glutaredoxin)